MKLHRKLCAKKASPAEIEEICKYNPQSALIFGEASLTGTQVAASARRVPGIGIAFAWQRLPPDLLAQCIRRAPAIALLFLPDKLSPEQWAYCKRRAPNAAKKLHIQIYEALLQKNSP